MPTYLKAIGLSWERKQLRDKGDVLTRYQVLPLSDLEQALTDAIARRIDERITEATKQAIALRITVRTFLNSQTLSLLTVPCSLFPVPLRVAL